jgi:pyruvate/2-oxoglutarate dehydrogenase complex dihydrolipoamide acyltransferase (E2) component
MRKTILSCAAVAMLAAAPAASAADRTGTVDATKPTFTWDGTPGTSVGTNVPEQEVPELGSVGGGGVSVGNLIGCFDKVADCDETLIKVDTAGTLTLTADAADDSKDVLDMYVYASDESGAFSEGTPIFGFPEEADEELGGGSGGSTSGDEKIVIPVTPGYYVVQIKYFLAEADTYKGAAVLSGFPEPAKPAEPVVETPAAPPAAPAAPAEQPAAQPAPQPAAQPQPAPAAKKKSKKAACKAKAKKVKNGKKRSAALKKCAKIKD